MRPHPGHRPRAIVAEDTPDGLKRQVSGDVVTVTVDVDPEASRPLLAGLPGFGDVTVLGATDAAADHRPQ